MANPDSITHLIADGSKSDFDNRFPTSREFSNHYFDSFERVRAKPLPYFAMTVEQRDTLRDVANQLDQEITTMSLGVAAIGELLHDATVGDSVNTTSDTIRGLGWFLNYMGQEMNEHINNLSMANDRLRHCRIVDSEQQNGGVK